MDVFMRDVSYNISDKDLTRQMAHILHGPSFEGFSTLPLNFKVSLFPDKKHGLGRHRGIGTLTLPTAAVGERFLTLFAGANPALVALAGNRRIQFQRSKVHPRQDTLEEIKRMPYLDPQALQDQERRAQEFQSRQIRIKEIQFGWEGRDWTFSAEYEKSCGNSGHMQFQEESRELRIKVDGTKETQIIAIRFSQIGYSAVGRDGGQAIIFFSLLIPPVFESELPPLEMAVLHAMQPFSFRGSIYDLRRRRRHSSFDKEHARSAAFTSLAARLVCSSDVDLNTFRDLCRTANLPRPHDEVPRLEHRQLFSQVRSTAYAAWLATLDWQVAFQVDALVFGRVVDLAEALALQQPIQVALQECGREYTAALIRHFGVEARQLWDDTGADEGILQCWARCRREFNPQTRPKVDRQSDDNFMCYHVVVTPTSLSLQGPFPERSNRVVRSYLDHTDHFVRVSFVDENHLQYRFDREVDGRDFIRTRVGKVLDGIEIAGTRLEFLAYSQSALKEHAVWFVKPFRDTDGRVVDAAAIIASLGSFHQLAFDTNLGFCPARYGARVSQAFTATDSSITVEADEIFPTGDIVRNGWCFTDGVGTLSPDLAAAIRKALYGKSRRRRRPLVPPSAFQIRLQGAKGMLSVDHTLSGRVICLRPSMIKFEAPNSTNVEIARAFDRPSRYFLNRPLIALLEGLGVPYEVFKAYQDTAVRDAQESVKAIDHAAKLLETHGLGGSFRLPSVMVNLRKLGFETLVNEFYQRMMEFAVHHILREMKQHARIPIPGGWTLVGVADIHGYLEPDQIFACLRCPECHRDVYLEGPTLVSRSPTIHPGDVQILNAIGKPRDNTPFREETLSGCIVFSVQGIIDQGV